MTGPVPPRVESEKSNTQMMKPEEIFRNRTPGEWKKDWCDAKNDRGRIVFVTNHMFDGKVAEADAELILLMKRETIDKGINPESVERMKNTLRLIEKYYSDEEWQREVETEAIAEGHGSFVEVIMDYIKEALNAAKL